MSGLNTSLSIALQSLQQQATALEVTNNNIANANTPGYSRQTLLLTESPAVENENVAFGTGATLEGVQSIRDQLLTLQIQQQTQQQASANAQASGLASVQAAFASGGSDLGTSLSAFFSSVSALSASPDSTPTRQAVLTAAQNVASSFNQDASTLTGEQTVLDSKVSSDVNQINQLSQQIAAINQQLQQQPGGPSGTDAEGALTDQQNQLTLQLSKLTNVSVIQTEHGESITTGSGTPLVLGGTSYALQTTTTPAGLTNVLDSNGKDITSAITGGDLGGVIQLRDTTISGLLTQLDTLANQFGTAVNSAQALGSDQNGVTGAALFSVPGAVSGSAAQIAVTTVDPAKVAASSDGSPDSNGNVANLSAVGTNLLPSGTNPTDSYADIIFQIGSVASKATAESNAVQQSLLQLNSQQSSVSGVSIDEESANLIRYQQSYEAAARVISTLQSLFAVTINLGNGGGA